MKVFLLNPPNEHREGDDFYVTFPLGLGYVAGYLEQQGHEVEVFDSLAGHEKPEEVTGDMYRVGAADEEIVSRIESCAPDIVGISCSYTVQYPSARRIAARIKEATKLPIVLGGAHASALPRDVLRDEMFDYAAIGEGELPMQGLCEHLAGQRPLAEVPGLAYREEGGIQVTAKKPLDQVNSLPMPARHLFDMDDYIHSPYSHNGRTLRKPYATLISSRGCPLKCVFCSVHTVWGRNNRRRDAVETVDEIEHLVTEYGIREIHFEDDMLTLDRDRVIAICNEIVRRGLDIAWATPNGIYVNTLTQEMLAAMKESGCYQLALAIESGNQNVLRNLMKKNISLKYARDVVKWMRELELGVYFFFIIGIPGEKREDVYDTIEYAKELAPDDAYFSIATPYPGTPLYDECKKHGYIPDDLDLTRLRPTQPVIETEFLSRQDLSELRDYAYEEWGRCRAAINVPWAAEPTALKRRLRASGSAGGGDHA